MHSIRTKITIATIGAIVITMLIVTIFSVVAMRHIGSDSAEQTLLFLCKAGQKNLDSYFGDIEREAEAIDAYVESDLTSLDDDELQAHLDRVSDFFKKVTSCLPLRYASLTATISKKSTITTVTTRAISTSKILRR